MASSLTVRFSAGSHRARKSSDFSGLVSFTFYLWHNVADWQAEFRCAMWIDALQITSMSNETTHRRVARGAVLRARVTAATKEAVDAAALRRDLDPSDILREAVREYLDVRTAVTHQIRTQEVVS